MIDRILEIIFSNIVFVVIIIGGLVSFFKRIFQEAQQQQKAGQGQQRSRPLQHEKTQPQPKPVEFDMRDILKHFIPVEEDDPPQKQHKQVEPAPVQIEEEEEHPKEQDWELRQQEAKQRIAEAHERLIEVRKNNKHRQLDLQLSGSEVMKGIVLAEVLGPPRSKQVHISYDRKRK